MRAITNLTAIRGGLDFQASDIDAQARGVSPFGISCLILCCGIPEHAHAQEVSPLNPSRQNAK